MLACMFMKDRTIAIRFRQCQVAQNSSLLW